MSVIMSTEGLIPIEAFTTFGIHSKPNSDNPLGRFGTGLKYGMAVILRLGGKVRLWIGKTEYEFYTSKKDFRGKSFDVVRMRKRTLLGRWSYTSLPFTTELGKGWAPWQALREFEANTRDEGGQSVLLEEDDASSCGLEGVTTIEIICPEIEDEYRKLDTIFLPIDDMKSRLLHEDDQMAIYSGSSDHIFYRGMRVTTPQRPCIFTYDLKRGVTLTEDRTSKFPYWDSSNIMQSLMKSDNEVLLDTLTNHDSSKKVYEMTLGFDSYGEKPAQQLLTRLAKSAKSSSFALPRLATYYSRHTDSLRGPSHKDEISVKLQRWAWHAILDHVQTNEVRAAIEKALETKTDQTTIPF